MPTINRQVKINGYWDGQPIWRELTAEDMIQAVLLEIEKNKREAKEKKHD